MHNAEGMKILQPKQYLVRELFSTALRDVELAFLKIVEEVAATDKLGDDEESCLILVCLEKAHDARMLAEPVDLDLGPELLSADALLAHDLDGDAFAGLLVDCGAYEPEQPFADSLLHIVYLKYIDLARVLHLTIYIQTCLKNLDQYVIELRCN